MSLMGGAPDIAHEHAALAAFGLQPERTEPTILQIWPENMETVELFDFMRTQWNVAPAGGVVGLRYEALPVGFTACGIPLDRQPLALRGLQFMESAAIEHINRKK